MSNPPIETRRRNSTARTKKRALPRRSDGTRGRLTKPRAQGAARLYLSYPNDDTPFARKFADLLRWRGHQVVMFDEHLALGDDWRRYMNEALKISDGVIVMVTEHSLLGGTDRLASQWVAAEIGAARAMPDKFVIPIIFGRKGDPRVEIPTLLDDLFTSWFPRSRPADAADAVSKAAAKHLERRDKSMELQLPVDYAHLARHILRLHEDVPFRDAVFVMMKFPDQVRMDRRQIKLLDDIWITIESELAKHGLTAMRADRRKYHDQLWENVCVYMLGCRFGIAILEDCVASELNPNIALEYGFMRALDRRVGLFRNVGFKHGRADLSGKLMDEFEVDGNLRLKARTLRSALTRWFGDIGGAQRS